MVLRQKRAPSPGNVVAPRPKRTALGDVTNQVRQQEVRVSGHRRLVEKKMYVYVCVCVCVFHNRLGIR